VDDSGAPIQGTEKLVEADALVLSVGLIPDNELVVGIAPLDQGNGGPRIDSQMRTEATWLFAAGNNVVIFDLADWVAAAGAAAGRHAAEQALGGRLPKSLTQLVRGSHVLHMVPGALAPGEDCHVFVRVDQPIVRGRLTIGQDVSQVLHGARPSEMIDLHLSKDQVNELCRSAAAHVDVIIE